MPRKPMTNGSPWKHILKFCIPVLAGSLLQQFYQTADTIIVGNFTGENGETTVCTVVLCKIEKTRSGRMGG